MVAGWGSYPGSPAKGAPLDVARWVTPWSREAETEYGAGRPCQHGLPLYIRARHRTPRSLVIES
jgi:hypothetical protein